MRAAEAPTAGPGLEVWKRGQSCALHGTTVINMCATASCPFAGRRKAQMEHSGKQGAAGAS